MGHESAIQIRGYIPSDPRCGSLSSAWKLTFSHFTCFGEICYFLEKVWFRAGVLFGNFYWSMRLRRRWDGRERRIVSSGKGRFIEGLRLTIDVHGNCRSKTEELWGGHRTARYKVTLNSPPGTERRVRPPLPSRGHCNPSETRASSWRVPPLPISLLSVSLYLSNIISRLSFFVWHFMRSHVARLPKSKSYFELRVYLLYLLLNIIYLCFDTWLQIYGIKDFAFDFEEIHLGILSGWLISKS